MFYCNNCGSVFENTKIEDIKNEKGLPNCPHCESSDIKLVNFTHCRCCGAKLQSGQLLYCSCDCKKKGELLWEKERRRKKLQLLSPLSIVIRELAEYNKEHNTNYTYGQYVAIITGQKGAKK